MRVMTFEAACSRYVHRFTMDHVPTWANKPMPNGKYYAPQFRSDREWYGHTLFPPNNPMVRGPWDTSCYTPGETWPLGQTLDAPYQKPTY